MTPLSSTARPRAERPVTPRVRRLLSGRNYALFLSLLPVLLLAVARSAEAKIYTAASASRADVAAAIALAADGDTVVVPAGTASWTSGLNISKGITLQGATTVSGDHATSMSASDQTIILDDVPRPNSYFLSIVLTPSQSFRLSGFTFRAGAITTIAYTNAVRVGGTSTSFRVDHCHFDSLYNGGVFSLGWIYGVIDHCVFDTGHFTQAGFVSHPDWGGKSHGDGSWAEPAYWGSDKFIFFEDNLFNNIAGTPAGCSIDSKSGGRYVVRYNTMINTQIQSHGTEFARERGTRAVEVYNNNVTLNSTGNFGQRRSGNIITHDNNFTAPFISQGVSVPVYRVWQPNPQPWGGADGRSVYDVNDTEGNGTNVPGHSPHLYESGTHTGASGATGLLTDSSKNWATNQWTNYSVTNTVTNISSIIKSNTSNTITYDVSNYSNLKFNPGDAYQIHRVLIAVDQCGRGQGDLLSGDPPVIAATSVAGWPHQVSEPSYSWLDKWGSNNVKIAGGPPTIQENQDFYNQAAAIGGAQAVGVGVGTLANRPAKCTTGVGYWATDQNTLYVATATDTWGSYYKPFTYPHPLVGGAPAPPSAPSNLRIQSGP